LIKNSEKNMTDIKKINVLLVESDPGEGEFLVEILGPSIFKIAIASNMEESINILSDNKNIDVAVIDISTSLEYNVALLKRIASDFSHLPCVLLSSFSNEELEAQSVRLTSCYLLFKHRVNSKILHSSIEQAIDHQNLFDQLARSKEELEISEQRFRTMIEKNIDVIVIFNKNTEIKYINPTGKKSFGEHGEQLKEHIKDFPIISGDSMMFSARDGDGQREYWEVKVVTVHWMGDTSFLAIVRDVTDWKKAEREFRRTFIQLERSNKDLETFAYVTSHDLQEPLRTVSGFMSLLQRKYGDQLSEQAGHYVSRSIAATTRMQDMILSLLDYSRLTTQTQAFKMNSTEKILDIALENLQEAIKSSGVTITRDKMPDLWSEENQLIRLFQNLIGNAIKFSDSKDPRIHIGLEETTEKIYKFSVRDNGIGIEPQYIARIFMIFQRLEKGKYPGTGIGLAMCKKIVEYHGGKIWVESESGEGSTFYFTLSAKPKGGR
jgi:signal transduction histidine kinase/DNA-binding NarL/FixJ family response regulator